MQIAAIYSPWLDNYQRQLKYIALTLCCVGILNLLAANWFYFPKFVQLYIPQILLLASCIMAAIYHPTSSKGHAGAISASVMTGLSLATYGQIYQTGADSYQLFLAWSVFLVPWLFYRLSSVYVLFCITSSLTLYLIGSQMWYLSTNMLIILTTCIFLLQILIAEIWFKPARLIILLPIAIFAIGSAFAFTIEYHSRSYSYDDDNYILHLWWIGAFILPAIIGGLYYYRKWNVGTATIGLVLAITTSIHILISSFHLAEDYGSIVGVGFITAALIFGWCYGIAKGLQFLLPNAITLANMPAAFGAWFSSFVLLITVFALSDFNLIITYVFLIIGLVGLKYAASLFTRQITYATILFCQCAIFINFGFDAYEHYSPVYPGINLTISLGIQIAITICAWVLTKNQFWRSLQLSILMVIIHLDTPLIFPFILPAGFIFWLVYPAKILDKTCLRPVLISLFIGILLNIHGIGELFLISSEFNYWNMISPLAIQSKLTIYNGLCLAITCFALYKYRNYLNPIIIAIFTGLGLILIWYSQYDLFLLLAALVIICQQKDNFLLCFSMFVLAAYLYLLYHMLNISFIVKGGALLLAGIITCIVAMLIARQLKTEAN